MKKFVRVVCLLLVLLMSAAVLPVRADESAYIREKGETEIYLKPGESRQLEVEKLNFDDTNSVTWSLEFYQSSSSSGTPADIDENGLVTAGTLFGNGSITAKADTGSTVYFQLHVYDEPTELSFYQDEYVLTTSGGSQYIRAVGNTANSQSVPYTVTIGNPAIVAMDSNFYFRGLSAGSTTITAEYNGMSAVTTVTVLDGDYADYIERPNYDRIELDLGSTYTINDYVLKSQNDPDKTEFADEKVSFACNMNNPMAGDDAVIQVDENGTVTANAYGRGDVKVSITNGEYQIYTFIVNPPINSISFNEDMSYSLPDTTGSKLSLYDYYTTDPENVDISALAFESSNPDVIEIISAYGGVNVKAAGTATITVSSKKDPSVNAAHEFEVYKTVNPTKMTLRNIGTQLYAGHMYLMRAEYTPDSANTNTSWMVDNPDVASVSSVYADSSYAYLNVTQPGKFTLTATNEANPNMIRTAAFTVVEGNVSEDMYTTTVSFSEKGVQGDMTVNPDTYYMELGKGYELFFGYRSDTVIPRNAYEADPAEVYRQITLIENDPDPQGGMGFVEEPGYVLGGSMICFIAKETGSQTLNYRGKTIQFVVTDAAAEVEVEVDEPVVENPANVDQAVIDTLSTAGDLGMGEELTSAFDVKELQSTIELPEEAEKAVVRTYMEIKATEFTKEAGTNNTTLVLDITPKYEIIAVDENGTQIGETLESGTIDISDPVTMTIPVGDLFDAGITTIYVRHKKGETVYQYEGELKDGIVTFVNPHGFSEFALSAVDTAIVKINDAVYESLQDGVDSAASNDTITVTAAASADMSAVVSKEITITIDNQSGKNVTLTPGEGYEMTVDGSTYTFTKKAAEPAKEDTEPAKEETKPAAPESSVPTGDGSGVLGYSIMLITSVMIGLAVLYIRRKEEKSFN